MLQVRLLGAVGAASGPDDVPLGGPKPRAVLAVLALAAPRACSSDTIIDGLWGEEPPASARNAVQVNITGLRKSLRPHGVDIERVGDGYALRGPVSVDVDEFETLVSGGRAALRSGDPVRSAQQLVAALELWAGTPFGGIDAAPFTVSARSLLQGTRSAALADLAEAHLRSGDPHAAAATAQHLLDDHPYDERGWITLATAHYWQGQQDLALQTCRRARDVLLDELGIDPTAALAEVESQILLHTLLDRSLPTPEAPAVQEPPLPALPQLVAGREELVVDVLDRLARGQRLVTLVGLGGIGKTTLALAVAHRVADQGRSVAFCPLETDVDPAAALDRVCRVLGVDPEDDPSAALAAARPAAVLVLDNAEQVVGLGAALDRLLGAAPGAVALVTSRRPTGARLEHAVAVPPLSPPAAEQVFLAHAERVRPGVGHGQAAAVHDLCALLDGIPLALELAAGRVRTLTPLQLLRRIEDHRTSVLDGSATTAVPDRQASLGRVLREAYDALTGPGRRLFELLGSYDGWASIELLEASAQGWVPDTVEALEELVACGLVELDLDGRTRMRRPVRELAHSLGPRRDLDARLVRQAVQLAAASAPQLFGAGAGEALHGLRRDEDTLVVALSRAVGSGDAASAAALVLGLNRYWLLSGRLTEGRRWVQRAVELPGHTAASSARLGVLAGTYASYLNHPGTATVLTEALERVARERLPVDRLVVNGWCCLAAYAAHHRDVLTAEHAVRRAAELAAVSADPGLVALARDIDGHVAAHVGDRDRSLAAKLSGIADAQRSGDAYDVVNLMINAADDLMYLDRLDEALAYADEAFDRCAGLDVGPILGSVLLIRGMALTAAERPAAARGNLLEALRIARDRYPDPLATADVLFGLGACAAQELLDAEACRCFGAAEAMYAEHGVTPAGRLFAAVLRSRELVRDRVGDDRFTTMAALGGADRDRAVERLLSEGLSRS